MYYPDTQNPSVEWMKVQEESKGVWTSSVFLGEKVISSKTFKTFRHAFSWGESNLDKFKNERGSN